MNLTIEQLKFAREIGATHIDKSEDPNCWVNIFYRKDCHAYIFGHWDSGWATLAVMDFLDTGFEKIDFSPLDDYYADKAVDIAATSVPDGYYHDDEEDKLKPLKPETVPDMVNHQPHCQAAQDLRKAAWYLNRAADELDKNNERSGELNK